MQQSKGINLLVVQFSVTDQVKLNDTQTDGGVAQLGEHLPCKQGVMGSIPIISTSGRRGKGNRKNNHSGA